jgi:hypothetical protein
VTVIFKNPLLLHTDIIALIGSDPAKPSVSGDKLIFNYMVRKKGSGENRTYDIPLSFEFKKDEKVYKLVKAFADKNISDVLSFGLINELFNLVCLAKRDGRSVKFDLKNLNPTLLPRRRAIIEILGKPDENSHDTMIYYYELEGSDTAKIVIHFHRHDDQMKAIVVNYFRYELSVDFVGMKAIGKVRDFFEFVDLGMQVGLTP